MSARQSNLLKLTSLVLLVIVFYCFTINVLNYFTVGSFASPLSPRSLFEEISGKYLYYLIGLLSCLLVIFLLHKHGKYLISITVSVAVIAVSAAVDAV